MKKTYVEAFNIQFFNRDGRESAILKIKYYNPTNLIFQHLTFKEKFKIIEINRMRSGYIFDTSTSVDIREIVKIGGKQLKFTKVLYIEKNLDYLLL